MNVLQILSIINGFLGAVPELVALVERLNSGGTVTATEVQSVLAKYVLDRITVLADIATAEAAQAKA